jgi:hypothetical protein
MNSLGSYYANQYVGSVLIAPDLKTMFVGIYKQGRKFRFQLVDISHMGGTVPTTAAFSPSNNPFEAPNTSSFNNSGTGTSSSGNTGHMVEEKCTYCNGTGVDPVPHSIAAYGDTSQHYCEYCHMTVSASHGVHLACKLCNGKGNVQRFRAY